MTTSSFVPLPPSAPVLTPEKKKRVLLLDTSTARRDLRAEAMRNLGVEVDCACDISEARLWWRADLYNLVLVNMDDEREQRDKFCDDVRGATPPQQIGFLVGKPGYIADLPHTNGISGSASEINSPTLSDLPQTTEVSRNGDVRWGIMEASRRISEVRSVAVARATAIRNRPTPPRDMEVRDSRRGDVVSRLAYELRKEELL